MLLNCVGVILKVNLFYLMQSLGLKVGSLLCFYGRLGDEKIRGYCMLVE